MSGEGQTVFLKPNAEIAVKFVCERCEDARWPAVNPARNCRRALKYLEEGDTAMAKEFIEYALEELGYHAQWHERKPDAATQNQVQEDKGQ